MYDTLTLPDDSGVRPQLEADMVFGRQPARENALKSFEAKLGRNHEEDAES